MAEGVKTCDSHDLQEDDERDLDHELLVLSLMPDKEHSDEHCNRAT